MIDQLYVFLENEAKSCSMDCNPPYERNVLLE